MYPLSDGGDSGPVKYRMSVITSGPFTPVVRRITPSGDVYFGEVFAGVLQNSGRASFVGEPTRGNVEVLYGYAFIDGSELWLAHATFEPLGLPAGVWEGVGVQPDVMVPMTWELFSEADDPGLATAVGVLQGP